VIQYTLLPGVDVMITIFCDFRQFLAKMALFSKTNVMIKILHNLALFWVKNTYFSPIFWQNILKIITTVPKVYVCRYTFYNAWYTYVGFLLKFWGNIDESIASNNISILLSLTLLIFSLTHWRFYWMGSRILRCTEGVNCMKCDKDEIACGLVTIQFQLVK
jgi:hypothetical protein